MRAETQTERVERRRERFDAAVALARDADKRGARSAVGAWHAAADSARELLQAQRALDPAGIHGDPVHYARMARLRARRYTVGGGIERPGEVLALLVAAVLQLKLEQVAEALDPLRPGDETLLAHRLGNLADPVPDPTLPYLVLRRTR